jgi:hypothetical protein
MATATMWAMATAIRLAGNKEEGKGKGSKLKWDGDEDGGH